MFNRIKGMSNYSMIRITFNLFAVDVIALRQREKMAVSVTLFGATP